MNNQNNYNYDYNELSKQPQEFNPKLKTQKFPQLKVT